MLEEGYMLKEGYFSFEHQKHKSKYGLHFPPFYHTTLFTGLFIKLALYSMLLKLLSERATLS